MIKPRFIYGMSDPRTQEVRYVGATVNPGKRFREHLVIGSRAPTREWVASLRKQGLEPEFRIIEEASGELWAEAEDKWISHFQDQGYRLLNRFRGGNSGVSLPIDQWAHDFDSCIECNRSDRRHAANGLCIACYKRLEHRQKQQPDRPYYDWSLDYAACVECGTTERPHKGYGRCENCYARYKRRMESPKRERWSRQHDECIICHTTERRHQGHGLCSRCHARERYRSLSRQD